MRLKSWLIATAGALALGLMGSAAQAAPAGGAVATLKGEASGTSDLHEAAWYRRCHYHRGHRHCRRYWRDDFGYYDDDDYPYSGYYGYGPGLSFFFGGGRGHRHHGHGFRGHRGHFHGHRGHGGRGHGRGRR